MTTGRKSTDPVFRYQSVARFGRIDEWHVVFSKSFYHLEFDLLSRLCETVVVFRPSFRHARFKAVGAIRDTMCGDGL